MAVGGRACRSFGASARTCCTKLFEFGPGQAVVIPAGFKGSFEVLETLTKTYAIVDGDAPAA